MKRARVPSRALLATAVLAFALPLAAAAPSRGLQVAHEVLDTIEGLNGVPVRVERFTGRDVPELLRRWLANWSADPGTVGQLSDRGGGWLVHARLLEPAAQEVIQVRDADGQAELLWSRIPLAGVSGARLRTQRLPAGCSAGPGVQGRDGQGAFELSFAVCRGAALRRQEAELRSRGVSGSCNPGSGNGSSCLIPLAGSGAGRVAALLQLHRPPFREGR